MARSVNAGGNIERSVVVTGDGNVVSLSFGGAFAIPLDRRQISSTRPRRNVRGYDPLPLLVPDADAFPLVGRAPMLAELRAWLDEESDVSIQALIGRAGTGKTRLAVELCKAVDGAAKPGAGGWVAGFLRPGDLEAFIEGLATRSFDWARPTLLAIDDAAAVHRELARWLDRLASESIAGKLRLLLLDREAPDGFGWWHDLTRPTDNRRETRRDLFVDPDRPRLLPDLAPGEERRVLLEAALAAAAGMMGDKAPGHSLAAPGADSAFDSALASDRFGNPLNLAMAGLIAAERGSAEALALRRLDAARHFARHELGRMERIAQGEGIAPLAVGHALGFNGLAGGLTLATLREDLAAELEAARIPAAPAALADVLMQELPPPRAPAGDATEPRLGTILPDLIGEGVIVESLLVGPADRALRAGAIVGRAFARTGTRTAKALMRLIQDYGGAAEDPRADPKEREVARVVLGLLAALTEAIPETEIEKLETLVDAFPQHTTILREAAAEQTRRLADHWQRVFESVDAADEHARTSAREDAARWAGNLSIRLAALGQREAALAAGQTAVDHYRVLAVAPNAVKFVPFLCGSLINLVGRLGQLGRLEEKLAAAQEAVDLGRFLAAFQPEVSTPDLAMSLNNLAVSLSGKGDHEAALGVAWEAIELYRGLDSARAEMLAPDLAGALSAAAGSLSALGRPEEALAPAQEAVDICRALAAERPDSFTPDLANWLYNLGSRLSDVGRHEDALAPAQESVALWRVLAATRPDAFTSDLARSLNGLANRLGALGRHEEAQGTAQEATSLFRALAAARPDAFTPDLAESLEILANHLGQFGQKEAAMLAAQEASQIFQALITADPYGFAHAFAQSVGKVAHFYVVAGIEEAALISARAAIQIHRSLTARQPTSFTPGLAASLSELAGVVGAAGEREEALAMAEEAVDLHRALAAGKPDAFTPHLATSLSCLGDRLEEIGRAAEAIEAAHQSVGVLAPYFRARPGSLAGKMETCLRAYLSRAEAEGIEADAELTDPIIEILQDKEDAQ